MVAGAALVGAALLAACRAGRAPADRGTARDGRRPGLRARLDRARRSLTARVLLGGRAAPVSDYETLAEQLAVTYPGTEAVGEGEYDLIGRTELGVLIMEGLTPTDTLVDLGCGNGRLAVHALPYLQGGSYVGIEISATMLERARALIRRRVPVPPCSVRLVRQATPRFDLPPASADMICAFSVFTHMEHEDTYRYLKGARRVIRPGGRFVLSCLPMDLAEARQFFEEQAAADLAARWRHVRNITTTVEMMETIAGMAGWQIVRWYRGDEASIRLPDTGERQRFGQSACVLVPLEGG